MSVRVCYMNSVHGPKDVRIFHKECVSLAAHGFDVHLVVRQEGDDEERGVRRWGGGATDEGHFQRVTRSVVDVVRKAAGIQPNHVTAQPDK